MDVLKNFEKQAQEFINKYRPYREFIENFEEEYRHLIIDFEYFCFEESIDEKSKEKHYLQWKTDGGGCRIFAYIAEWELEEIWRCEPKPLTQREGFESNLRYYPYIPAFIAAFTAHIEKFMQEHKETTGFDEIV